MTPPAVVTPRRSRLPRARRYARGIAAVAGLLTSAADVLFSALTGWAPIGRTARQLGRVVADAWHRGARTIPAPRVYIASPAIREDTSDDHPR